MEPTDLLPVLLVGSGESFRSRLEAALIRRGLPGLLLEDSPRNGRQAIMARLLTDEDLSPLRWVSFGPGQHGWEPVRPVDLMAELSAELGAVVDANGGLFGGSAARDEKPGADPLTVEERAALSGAFSLDTLTWYQPGNSDGLSVSAARAGESLHICRAGRGIIGQASMSPEAVFESGAWAARGGLFLARSGERRGAGFHSKDEPLVVHWWDEKIRLVDPSQRWEMDGEGRHVRDYLQFFEPEVETEPWTTNFRLDGAQAQELRVVLRAESSDDRSFDRLVRAVGLPSLLADVATERVSITDAEGAKLVKPDTLWGSLKEVVRDEVQRPTEYPAWASPLTKWEGHRQRRSAVYLAINGTAVVLLGANVALSFAAGEDFGSMWWKAAALVLILGDLIRPRRGKPGGNAGTGGTGAAPTE
ncbi:hypothetical protein D9V28_15110 [Mycetocola zhadangensis]|uniref:Uncharacterized protein n=1 Tax=Mycetocola zhadangensis TaxID=1164595 RepID=A0A3L7IVU0_9MICO|nr:hypothetical protein D9V28_15110 [Mycetocola zhadangensis]